MKEHSVDNKEASWNRMNSAEKTNITSQFSKRDDGKTASHMRRKKKSLVLSGSLRSRKVFPQSLRLSVSSLQHKCSRWEVGQTRTRKWGKTRLQTHGPCVVIFNWVHTVKFASVSCWGMWKRCGRHGAAKRNQEVQKENANRKVVLRKSSELMLTAALQFFQENRRRVCVMN